MDMDYEAIFGLDPEIPEGEEEQELADPAEAEESEGEEEQEPADPAVEADGGDDAAEEDEQPEEEPGKRQQSAEERREAAAQRRRREQQAAIDAALQQEREKNQAEWDRYFAEMGIRDPYHGNRIVKNRVEYEEYEKERSRQTMERELKAGRVTAEQFDEAVQREAARTAAQQIEEARRREAGISEVNRQFAALQAAYPSVKSLGELMQDQAFVAALPVTRDMTRAYRMAHVDEIEASAKAAAQAGRDSGKSHLRRAGTRGGGAPMVTQDVIEQYRIFDPDITVEEIRRFEAQYQKHKKKE